MTDDQTDATEVSSLAGQTIISANHAQDEQAGYQFTRVDLKLADGRTVRMDCRRMVIAAAVPEVI
jgi:hypothetical protein